MNDPKTPIEMSAHIRELQRLLNEALARHRAVKASETVLCKTIVRQEARIAELEKDSDLLAALQAGGVDNWEGYDGAVESLGLGG